MSKTDGNKSTSGAKVPVDRPDPKIARRPPAPGSTDRPGFDLGGASENVERPTKRGGSK